MITSSGARNRSLSYHIARGIQVRQRVSEESRMVDRLLSGDPPIFLSSILDLRVSWRLLAILLARESCHATPSPCPARSSLVRRGVRRKLDAVSWSRRRWAGGGR